MATGSDNAYRSSRTLYRHAALYSGFLEKVGPGPSRLLSALLIFQGKMFPERSGHERLLDVIVDEHVAYLIL